MRSLDNWGVYYDNTNKPLFGRLTFYKLHTTEKQPIYNEDGTVPLPNPISTSQYGMTDVQVFLQDADYTIKAEKWIGAGEYTLDDPNVGDWEDIRTFDNLYPAMPFDTPEGAANIVEISTMADLRAVDVSGVLNYAKLLGYRELGDMPPQYYKLVDSPSATIQDDGGSIIRPEGSTSKVWMLIPQENIDVRVFGVFPTQAISIQSSDTSNIHNCFTYANNQGKDVYFPQYYTNTAYYWIEGGTHSIWQKMVVDQGVHIVAKPLTTSRLRIGEIQYYGNQLFISDGSYGNLDVDCDTVKTSWGCNTWENWHGDVKHIIVDGLNGPYNFYDATVTFEATVSNKVLYFENCLITSNKKMQNCVVNLQNCGAIKDSWMTGGFLTTSGCILDPSNFEDINQYIKCKNIQNDPVYGDLGERTVSDVMLINGAVAENANFQNVTVLGSCELHNVSGTITGNGANISLNLIDCWITFINTDTTTRLLNQIDMRRGALLSSALINLVQPCTFEDVNINAKLVTPYNTSTFKRCTINQPLATFNVEVYDSVINSTITTYPDPSTNVYTFRIEGNTFIGSGHHYVNGENAGGILTNCTWINNINETASQFVSLNRDVLDPDDTHHTYRYEGNTGKNTLQYKAAKWTGKLHDPTNASCGRQIGSWNPSDGGPGFITWTWTGAAMLVTGQAATDINLYIVEFQMFSVGTTNLGQLSLRTTPPSFAGIPDPYQPTHVRKVYVYGTAMTASLSDVERTRAEWQYDQTGMPFCKGYAFVGGYTWRVTNAGTMFAVNSSIANLLDSDFNFEIYQ